MARAQAEAMLNRNLGDTTFMHEIIMGYQGEMSLKGLNRNQFESAMMKILRYRLKTVGKFKVYCTQSTFYMEPEEEDVDMDLAFDRVSKVFGLAALSRAVVCDKDFDTICQTAEDYLGASLHGIRTFKVEARRSDKTYPMTSPELMRELGAYLLGKHNYLKVDVHNPDFKVIVEIRDYGAYIHGPKVPGEGGLPVGTSGRALNMLSGGIDSPVAAYRMAKRGLALDHIHFASPPYTSERAKLKVKALAQLTSIYTGSSNLFVVPYTKPQEYIRDNAPDVLFTVLMRRSMMRIANVIAKKQGCEALITGESIGQVASQTVHSLAVKRASKLGKWIEENGITAYNNTEETMEIAAQGARDMDMVPYYLYRQKNMSGNFENVGYSKEDKYGIYNILIMEEKQTIVACGAGTITKRVYPNGRIERCDNVKDVGLYIEKVEEMIQRKQQLFSEE